MSAETFYCPVQIAAARMYEDPEPEEMCENEVENEGDLCGEHDSDARAEDDYERYLEMRREELVMDR